MLRQKIKIYFFMLKEMVCLTLHVIGVSADYLKAHISEKSLHNS